MCAYLLWGSKASPSSMPVRIDQWRRRRNNRRPRDSTSTSSTSLLLRRGKKTDEDIMINHWTVCLKVNSTVSEARWAIWSIDNDRLQWSLRWANAWDGDEDGEMIFTNHFRPCIIRDDLLPKHIGWPHIGTDVSFFLVKITPARTDDDQHDWYTFTRN